MRYAIFYLKGEAIMGKGKFVLSVAAGIIWILLSLTPCQAQFTCTESMFDDVDEASVGLPFCHYIESFAALGITGGCSTAPPRFCPDNYVTRGQMAVFLTTALDMAVGAGQTESISSDMIQDGTITNADISAAAGIDISKLSGVAAASHVHSANDISSGTVSSAVTFSNASNVFTGTFTGNGSGLTNLNPSNLLSGTAGISITGSAANVTGVVALVNGGTGDTTAAGARLNLGAAKSGANSDIASLSGLTTPLSVAQGGTGSGTKNFVDLSTDQTIGGNKTFSNQIVSSIATGTAPLQIASTTMVTNLNSEMVAGKRLADLDSRYAPIANRTSRTNTLYAVDSSTNTVGYYNSITTGSDGFPVISYYDSSTGALKVAKCTGLTCAPATVTLNTVDSGATVGGFSSIAIGADGFPVISYLDWSNGNLKVAKCGDASCTAGYATLNVVDSSADDVGQFTSIAIGMDGFPVISYYDWTNGDLKVAKCEDASCTSVTRNTVDSTGDVGGYSSIAIGTDGLPVISYYDFTNGNLKVAKCADASCLPGLAILSAVDSGGDVGEYTSITIGADGFPVISYFDFTNSNLKVAKCGNLSCTPASATLNTVDSGGITGGFTSITVSTDGFPIISYFETADGSLKVAKCGDTSCATAARNTVDSGAVVGGYSSITIGIDGLPVIAYFDADNGDLKVAKCANTFCLNNWSRR
jgi:hypothetical protein